MIDAELSDILDRGLRLSEKYRGGERQGTNWTWADHVEGLLEDYWRRRLRVQRLEDERDVLLVACRAAFDALGSSSTGEVLAAKEQVAEAIAAAEGRPDA